MGNDEGTRSGYEQAPVDDLDALDTAVEDGLKTPEQATAVFDCDRIHAKGMRGEACAKRWQSRRRQKHDTCYGCPDGERRAQILKIEEPSWARYGRSGYRGQFNPITQQQIARAVPAKGKP